ncbi:dnaJ homolog subfamily C member 4 isoform X2 [Dunckerocampus dactyliophorus]|uniref:dnaJ homolog subfamily C member 4 isoform X2 n=1 Tax=Dunckerocampus dactyliophorus TaxID=161453 RepID=UPI002404D357|nr:dnaJ homolog subfamily C member 4 isoform X2 [Dunckerocampus dactyliophorus]
MLTPASTVDVVYYSVVHRVSYVVRSFVCPAKTSQGAGRRAVADITIVPFSCNCLNKRCGHLIAMQLEAQLRLCQSCLWCWKSGLRVFSQSVAQRKAANYYDLLGVKCDATLDEIKNAFFDKSKKLHPDSDPSNPALHSQFVQLNEAYRVLSKEPSRREYDFKIRHPYGGGGGQAFRSASSHGNSTAAQDNMRYWEQVYQSHTQEMSAEEREQQRRRNFRLMGYCLLTMALSVGVHFIFFRKLEEVHTNYMDEKDRVIAEIYKESKERARVNGFKKQTEILRQKHAEFVEKYKMGSGGEK